MEIVEVNCPRSIDLKNIVGLKENSINSVLQTVDIFDKVIISNNVNQKGIFIKSNSQLDESLKNDIKNIINIFCNYINKNIDILTITIEKNKINLLENKYNILSGILLGLNVYFASILSIHELVYLGSLINNLIGYYLVCGYKKIDIYSRNYYIGENPYKKYLLFYDLKDNEQKRLKEYILNNNIEYDDTNEFNFIAIKDKDILRIPFIIKKEFKDIKSYECSNINRNKVLKKYLNNFG